MATPNSTDFTSKIKNFETPTYVNHKEFGRLRVNAVKLILSGSDIIAYIANVTDVDGRNFDISIPYCLYVKNYITDADIDFMKIYNEELALTAYTGDSEYGPFEEMLRKYLECRAYAENPANYQNFCVGVVLPDTPVIV